MTVEIRELVVRAVIREPQGNTENSRVPNQDDIVAECVEKVLEILKEEQER